MKPKKILREATRVALASFGQMVLREGAVWAARRLEKGERARREGEKGRRRAAEAPRATLEPLLAAGARYLEDRFDALVGALGRDARRAREPRDGDREAHRQGKRGDRPGHRRRGGDSTDDGARR